MAESFSSHLGRKTLDSFNTRPHHVEDPRSRRDTVVMVSVFNQDRRPPHGTEIAQGFLKVEEGYKMRTGSLGPCPHCQHQLRIRILMERVD